MHVPPQQSLKITYEKALRLAQAGQWKEASTLLDGLALQAPKSPEIHIQRARLAARMGHPDKRRTAIDAALSLRPNDPTILTEAIATYTALEGHDQVLMLLDRQIAQNPTAIKHQAEKALYLQRTGQFAASEKLFRKLIKKHPHDAELYRMLAATLKFKPGDPLIAAMRRLSKHPKLSKQGKLHIHFALAKVMEDTGQTDKVFAHLRQANAAQAAVWPDDPDDRAQERQAVLKAQDKITPIPDAKGTDPGLIFVTGLPRSGTTLAEQIIASHSQVQAGGEMATALKCAYKTFGDGAAMRPISSATPTQLKAFVDQLSAANSSHSTQGTPWLTDKSIMAFMIYGLLHATLPNARFIVIHRDPRDIAVSIYKNHFKGGTHRYANDLAAIADVIKAFRQVIAHWRDTLPNRFAEIHYEDLVADPVTGSQTLIRAAGLDWEDQCLDFHKSGGTVNTLSLHQVRQPIYQSSAQAWRRYEADLKPFFDAWGDTPWD